MWLNLQKLYELRLAEQTAGEKIRRVVSPMSGVGGLQAPSL